MPWLLQVWVQPSPLWCTEVYEQPGFIWLKSEHPFPLPLVKLGELQCVLPSLLSFVSVV